MKILYFHGFASSGATGTAETLRRLLPEVEVISPDIPVDPTEALPYLRSLCEQENPDLIIGTSMGAMYAQQMFGYKKICVNPAFNMSTMSKVFKTGEHKFLNGRKDNQKTFKITKEIIQKHNMMERQQFKGITPFDKENTYGLFGIHDTTVNTYDLFKKYYKNAQRFDGEHHLNEKALKTAVVPLAKQILGLC
ncbi:MAG: hypothetical protein K6E52_05600 [Bacteroidaceae bacterium]|nr:hypothetical protein [Bacteroidaceae bacterium]